jgi:hypothetical protein
MKVSSRTLRSVKAYTMPGLLAEHTISSARARTNAAFQQPVAHCWLFDTGSHSATALANSSTSYAGGAHVSNRKGVQCRHDGEWAALLCLDACGVAAQGVVLPFALILAC